MQIRVSHRPTIMDGEVVTFATEFEEKDGLIGGKSYRALGPFEISASRNCVMVHRASLRGAEYFDAFLEALAMAWHTLGVIQHNDYRHPFIGGGDERRALWTDIPQGSAVVWGGQWLPACTGSPSQARWMPL